MEYVEFFFPLSWTWREIGPWLDARCGGYAKGYYLGFNGHVWWIEPITSLNT